MKRVVSILLLISIVLISGCAQDISPVDNPNQLQEDVAIPQEEETSIPEAPIIVKAVVTYPVKIFGRNGFIPYELTVNVDDSVTWTNEDPRTKAVDLVIRDLQTRQFVTSPIIAPGKEYSYVFPRQGNYEYWTTGYGMKGRVTVK